MVLNSTGPVHVAAQYLPELNSSYLHVSNYGGSSYAVFSLSKEDGSIADLVYEEYYGQGTGITKPSMEWSNPHGAFFNGPYVYIVDKGLDRIYVYEAMANGQINKIQTFDMPSPGKIYFTVY